MVKARKTSQNRNPFVYLSHIQLLTVSNGWVEKKSPVVPLHSLWLFMLLLSNDPLGSPWSSFPIRLYFLWYLLLFKVSVLPLWASVPCWKVHITVKQLLNCKLVTHWFYLAHGWHLWKKKKKTRTTKLKTVILHKFVSYHGFYSN